MGDAEVVNDCICWDRNGHSALEIRVARMSNFRTLLRWKRHRAASTPLMQSSVCNATVSKSVAMSFRFQLSNRTECAAVEASIRKGISAEEAEV